MMALFPSPEDLQIRYTRIQSLLQEQQVEACFVHSSVHIYYLTGYVFDGFVYIAREGEPLFFVRKPGALENGNAIPIRKPEDIPGVLKQRNLPLPSTLALEADQLTYNEYLRLQALFQPVQTVNATALLRRSRMLKTPWEIEQFRRSAVRHSEAYTKIPSLFTPGMTDLELQYEIERVMRRLGSIGIFRAFGSHMDIFMGSVLTGKNAETPSPCDFALGGGGAHPSIPIGANGSLIQQGQSVMVDMAGNFTAYLTDMTRVYAYGVLPEKAIQAHRLSIAMHQWLMNNGRPGLACAAIYEQSLQMAADAGLAACFMGIRQQAKFVGHGVGIEINELPVLTARSQDMLQPGMVFAYEPKFVCPGVGAVGIENTYLVMDAGIEKLTDGEEAIMAL
ncbi:MAG: Xaa-Pro peptidase family protein [Dysgonamonadaceae bacterium]|nr:Xaa-Pro peptidase family protein [Dysgonamonadaceae bacterium]